MDKVARVSAELAARDRNWTQLGRHLDVSKQSVTNWKKTGIPAKYYSAIDRYFNKPIGWTEFGTESPAVRNVDKLDGIMLTIEGAFRAIPEEQWGQALLEVVDALAKRLPRR